MPISARVRATACSKTYKADRQCNSGECVRLLHGDSFVDVSISYLTAIFTDREVGFLPFNVTFTVTEQVPLLTVFIAVPRTLHTFLDDNATVIEYLDPAGAVNLARDRIFDF